MISDGLLDTVGRENLQRNAATEPRNLVDANGLTIGAALGAVKNALIPSAQAMTAEEFDEENEKKIGNPLNPVESQALVPVPASPDAARRAGTTPIIPGSGWGAPASSFSGRSSTPLEPAGQSPPRNSPGQFNGTPYSGHAFDQMQNQGIPPSLVDQAIQSGIPTPSIRYPGTTNYYDPVNNVTVVRDATTGNVITVTPGRLRP